MKRFASTRTLPRRIANNGTAYNCLGEHGKSQADSGKAIGFNQDSAEYYVNRGIADSRWKNTRKPLPIIPKRFRSSRNRPRCFTIAALPMNTSATTPQAVADYSEASRLDPANFNALLNRGEIYEFYDEDELAHAGFHGGSPSKAR